MLFNLKKIHEYYRTIVIDESNYDAYSQLLNLEFPVFILLSNALVENNLAITDLKNQISLEKFLKTIGLVVSPTVSIENSVIAKLREQTFDLILADTSLKDVILFLNSFIISQGNSLQTDSPINMIGDFQNALFQTNMYHDIGGEFPITPPKTLEEKEIFNRIALNLQLNTRE